MVISERSREGEAFRELLVTVFKGITAQCNMTPTGASVLTESLPLPTGVSSNKMARGKYLSPPHPTVP